MQPKLSTSFFSLFLIFIFASQANTQNFFYSEPVGNYPYVQTNVIGRVKNNIIVWKYTPLSKSAKKMSEFLVYDDKMKLINRTAYEFSRPHETPVLTFINEENSFVAVIQYFENSSHVCKLIRFDQNANLLNSQLLERSSQLNANDAYVIVKSLNQKSFALLKIIPSNINGTIALQYHFIKNNLLIRSDKFVLPFDTLASGLGNALLDDDELIIPVQNFIQNGERLALFKIDLKNNSLTNTLRDLENGHLVLQSMCINQNEKYYTVFSERRSDDQNAAAANRIFVWQLNKDLTDKSLDTTLASINDISPCLKSIHYYSLNSIALNNNSSNIVISAGNISDGATGNYFSRPAYSYYYPASSGGFYEGRILSMSPQKDLNGNGYYAESNISHGSTWGNNFGSNNQYNNYGKPQKIFPQPAAFAILNIDAQNNLKWTQCFNVSTEENFQSLVSESAIVNTGNAFHIIYTKVGEKDKLSLGEIVLNNDGTYTIKQVISMNIKYKYILTQAVQLDSNSIIIPCNTNGKLSLARFTVE